MILDKPMLMEFDEHALGGPAILLTPLCVVEPRKWVGAMPVKFYPDRPILTVKNG